MYTPTIYQITKAIRNEMKVTGTVPTVVNIGPWNYDIETLVSEAQMAFFRSLCR